MITPGDWVVAADGLTVVERHSGQVICSCRTQSDAVLIARASDMRDLLNALRLGADNEPRWQLLVAADRTVDQADGLRR